MVLALGVAVKAKKLHILGLFTGFHGGHQHIFGADLLAFGNLLGGEYPLEHPTVAPVWEEWASSAMTAKRRWRKETWLWMASKMKGKVWMVTIMMGLQSVTPPPVGWTWRPNR